MNTEKDLPEAEEFERDDNGEIIIPEVEGIKEDEEIEIELDDDAEDVKGEEEHEVKNEVKSEDTTDYKTEYEKLRKQTEDTLTKLGVKVEDGDTMGGLLKAAAEASDMSVEEYKANKSKEDELAEAKEYIRQKKLAEVEAMDLAELKKEFSFLEDVDNLEKIPDFKGYAELRAKGLAPQQAFIASNWKYVSNGINAYNSTKAKNDSKSHLKTVVPVGTKDNSIRLTKSEWAEWRGLFPDKTDKEIATLYARTKNKE